MPFGMSPGSELSRQEKLDQILEGITDVHRNFDDLLITLSASMQEYDRNNAPINVNPVRRGGEGGRRARGGDLTNFKIF